MTLTSAGRRPPARPPVIWSTAGAFGRALGLALLAWAVAGTIAALSYLSLGFIGIPIVAGTMLGLGYILLVMLAHRASWLGLLAFLPGVFVLVGAVQYAPEAALERRGVEERVTIVGLDKPSPDSNRHLFELRTDEGRLLDEPLDYQGSSPPYEIGDRLAIIRDPEGTVPLEDAEKVDSAGKRGMLIGGATGWSLIALYAVRRGHVRRRRGQDTTGDVLDLF
ncbi:hypothetical protein [Streptomyces sp. 6N223]|uniref:hypothetical protein n=1 Tax=Streptomyces sp. 6N223 TaxID=3457412 RepID=UPI003FD46584